MSRVAVIGSCITRDLWPINETGPQELLYISRTSLPSLFAAPVRGAFPATPPAPLKRHQHNALVADLTKTQLNTLVAYRPTHLIFDFIDERFDLLKVDAALITDSWELEASGYLGAISTGREPHRIPRLSLGCDQLWADALGELSAVLNATGLGEASLILHESRWASRYRDAAGELRAFDDQVEILNGRAASLAAHNALLERYEQQFLRALPRARLVRAADRTATAAHRWGLSPFHYTDDYYRDIWRQLLELGV